jgi:hypothetical protein
MVRVKDIQLYTQCCSGSRLVPVRVKLRNVHIVHLYTQCCSGSGSGFKG